MIALLWEPVARTFSQYQVGRRGWGNQPPDSRPFEEAIEADLEILERGHRLGRDGDADAHRSYVRRSVYIHQIPRFREAYGERMMVIRSEDLFTHPQETCDRIFAFLDLPAHPLASTGPRNQGSYRNEIPHEDRLRGFFRPYNEALYDFLGVEAWWPY